MLYYFLCYKILNLNELYIKCISNLRNALDSTVKVILIAVCIEIELIMWAGSKRDDADLNIPGSDVESLSEM